MDDSWCTARPSADGLTRKLKELRQEMKRWMHVPIAPPLRTSRCVDEFRRKPVLIENTGMPYIRDPSFILGRRTVARNESRTLGVDRVGVFAWSPKSRQSTAPRCLPAICLPNPARL